MTTIDGNRAPHSGRFRLNSPQVVDEEIDGEIIVVNLASGNYYSLLEEGAEIWQLLCRGHSLEETTRIFQSRYGAENSVIVSEIAQFVAELEGEGLMVPTDEVPPGGTANLDEESLDVETGALSERLSFTAPKLNVYIDMKDLMLLDPIHEVDETGWPAAAPPNP